MPQNLLYKKLQLLNNLPILLTDPSSIGTGSVVLFHQGRYGANADAGVSLNRASATDPKLCIISYDPGTFNTQKLLN